MQLGLSASAAPNLIDRLHILLAVHRLWLHELRGRLDIAFSGIAGLRLQRTDFEQIRSGVARTFFNYNSRLQGVADTVAETLAAQSASLQSLETRLQRVSSSGSSFAYFSCRRFACWLRAASSMQRPRDPDDPRALEPQPSPSVSTCASFAHMLPFATPLPAPPVP